MSNFALEQMVEMIRKRGALRTPGLALTFHCDEAELDTMLIPLCAPGGQLISCDVEVAGKRVKEYRASTIGGGSLLDHSPIGRPRTASQPKKNSAFGSAEAVTKALAARFTPGPPAPASATPHAQRQEAHSPMSITDKIIAAIQKHGPMTTSQLRKHVSSANAATICAQLARKGKLVRLGGTSKATIYGIEGQKAPAAAAPAGKPAKTRAHKAPAAARDLKDLFNDKRVAQILTAALRGQPLELVPSEVTGLAIALTEERA